MKLLTKLIPLGAFLPALALAQSGGSWTGIETFFRNFLEFINDILVPLVFALAFLVFIWGVFTYFIKGGGDETAREKGKGLMLWGIIGFVVMVSLWGIVNILSTGLFGNVDSIQVIPDTPVRNN